MNYKSSRQQLRVTAVGIIALSLAAAISVQGKRSIHRPLAPNVISTIDRSGPFNRTRRTMLPSTVSRHLTSLRFSAYLAPRPGTSAPIAGRLAEYGPSARSRLFPYFEQQGVAYPPRKLTIVGLKQERRMEIYAPDSSGEMRFIRSYPILAASGILGPKLHEGDHQVPEGIYAIESLNPYSRFHLAMHVGYPNAFDREHAALEGRTNLGQNIMIHGNHSSAGCLAMGDPTAEELFVLAADTGVENIRVVLSPMDFRTTSTATKRMEAIPWRNELYSQIRTALSGLPRA